MSDNVKIIQVPAKALQCRGFNTISQPSFPSRGFPFYSKQWGSHFYILYAKDYNKIRERPKFDRVPHLCSQCYGCKSHQDRGVEPLSNSPKRTEKNADWDVKLQLKPKKKKKKKKKKIKRFAYIQ